MDEMGSQLGAILNNPEMMQKIMSIAQSVQGAPSPSPPPSGTSPAPAQPSVPASAPVLGDLDPGMIRRIAGILQQSGVDKNQQALLRALTPYLSQVRLRKLERAMRAARMAAAAGSVFGGEPFFSGR